MNGRNDRKIYYLDFTTEQLLGGKELLKSMPLFYNRVFFCRKYADLIWNGGGREEHFTCIALTCRDSDIATLRQIIKNNSLYAPKWDSLRYTESEDYGFSFIGGNIKYILMPFRETEVGFEVKSYDCETGMCYTTMVPTYNRNSFAVTNFNEQGEIINMCDFDIEDINAQNSRGIMAPRKAQTQIAVYSNAGYVLNNVNMVLSMIFIGMVVAWISYLTISYFLT